MVPVAGVVVLAHPLVERHELPVSPLFVAAVCVALLVGIAQLVWTRARQAERPPAPPPPEVTSPEADAERRRPPLWFATRALGLALLVLAVVAGRFGDANELSNIAPSLVVGVGWPLLVAASLAFGAVWRWLDPFDSLGRMFAPVGAGDPAEEQRPGAGWAALPAAALVVYLTIWPGNLTPRTVGAALLVYAIAMLAGCLALGRRAWLQRVDVVRLFLGWIAAARRPRTWAPPRGAELVVAVLAGGLLYGLLRDSEFLITYGFGPHAVRNAAIALAVTLVVVVALTAAASRRERPWGAAGAVTLAVTVAAAGLAVALALGRNRFTTTAQLLVILVSDPLGHGADVFGTAGWSFDPQPLGVVGLPAVQLVVLVAAHVAAAVLATRHAAAVGAAARRGPAPALLVLTVLLGVSTAAVSATCVTAGC